jgi:hypothetical protein
VDELDLLELEFIEPGLIVPNPIRKQLANPELAWGNY